jgi:succinate dehydrogenase / fumarate reductase cytochrome b subunit
MPQGHHADRQHRAAEARHAVPREISEAMSTFAVQARKYRDQFSGMTAHLVQRATGLLLLAYLFLHVHTIRELRNGPAAFNAALATFRSPFFKLLEIALLGTVILHALNGVRITLIDLGIGHVRQRRMFWVYAVGLGALLFLAGAIPMFLNSVLKN